MKRNIVGKSFTYKYSEDFCGEFKTFYGNIPECKVNVFTINIYKYLKYKYL